MRDGTENTFCAEMIKKEFGEQRNLTLIPPDITFKKQLELDLGEISCTIEHVGGDHARDSSVIFVREEKVLFLGDCLYPNLYNQYTVNATLLLLDQLQKYDADTYVLSHEEPLSKSEFHVYVNLLRSLCHLTWKTNGNRDRITTRLANQMGGELGPIEQMAIDCFVNGIQSSG
ncbi:hypothetical protein GXN76_11405 [Kroppenstedtia pulmonis]|uniref:Metallo-beta-lactamase domain-containing protein n=1 Tax=Kroppenstedtia pulmonis TaxID=1380685 RepID=A0A7D4C7M0_9BACL|nr:MBL fold metallo-hydrolase [Kroppenstedtia pulmonis]QKG85016.1 hypothetical protein GXN76_11405 [Kroppenstedtia pulmonis]